MQVDPCYQVHAGKTPNNKWCKGCKERHRRWLIRREAKEKKRNAIKRLVRAIHAWRKVEKEYER
jgi:hypothetical protein